MAKLTVRPQGPARPRDFWDPFSELGFFSPWKNLELVTRPEESAFGFANERFVPAVDIAEEDERYLIHAEIPGAAKEDIALEVHENVLSLSGKKSETSEKDEEQNGRKVHSTERKFGFFKRSFRLPENVAADKIEAKFENGVLEVSVPKSKASKPIQIEVKQ